MTTPTPFFPPLPACGPAHPANSPIRALRPVTVATRAAGGGRDVVPANCAPAGLELHLHRDHIRSAGFPERASAGRWVALRCVRVQSLYRAVACRMACHGPWHAVPHFLPRSHLLYCTVLISHSSSRPAFYPIYPIARHSLSPRPPNAPSSVRHSPAPAFSKKPLPSLRKEIKLTWAESGYGCADNQGPLASR